MSLSKFVSRYGVLFARHKSTIGGNFHFCVSRFKLGKFAFLTVVLISIIWLGSTASLLQMIVIGVIVLFSFYENCY